MPVSKDLTGQRFGRLTVLHRNLEIKRSNKSHNVYWVCRCDCGNECSICTGSLLGGSTKSCGCLREEICNVSKKYRCGDKV